MGVAVEEIWKQWVPWLSLNLSSETFLLLPPPLIKGSCSAGDYLEWLWDVLRGLLTAAEIGKVPNHRNFQEPGYCSAYFCACLES